MYPSSTVTDDPFASCSAAPNLFTSEGPRPDPSLMWQVLHASSVNRRSPRAERGPSSPPLSHDWYAAGSITVTRPIMPECFVPQYSAQKMWYSPTLVALNHTLL